MARVLLLISSVLLSLTRPGEMSPYQGSTRRLRPPAGPPPPASFSRHHWPVPCAFFCPLCCLYHPPPIEALADPLLMRHSLSAPFRGTHTAHIVAAFSHQFRSGHLQDHTAVSGSPFSVGGGRISPIECDPYLARLPRLLLEVFWSVFGSLAVFPPCGLRRSP